MLIEGIRRTLHFFKNHSQSSWIICILMAAPFLSVYFLIMEISYFGVLQYSVMQIYKWVKPHWILYLAVGVILVISFSGGIFALPYCFAGGKKKQQRIKIRMDSFKMALEANYLGFVALHIVMLAVIMGVYFLANATASGYAILSKPKSAVVMRSACLYDWIRMGIGIFAGALQLMLSLDLVYFNLCALSISRKK